MEKQVSLIWDGKEWASAGLLELSDSEVNALVEYIISGW